MGKLNVKELQADMSRFSSGANNNFDKLVDGRNVRRVLWPKGEGNTYFYSDGYMHFGLGDDGKTTVTCPKTFDEKNPCPICEYAEELKKSKNKDDRKLANDIYRRRRIYVNVINRDGEDDEPVILPIGVTVLKQLVDTICDPDYGDITEYENGRDVTITRSGVKLNTKYTLLPKPNESIASKQFSEEELEEKMADLKKLFVEKSYDELKAILNGEEYESEDDEEEDEDDEEEDYEDMTLDELKSLCKKRKLEMPSKINKVKLIALLMEDDESEDNESEDEEDESSDEGDDSEDDDEELSDTKRKILSAVSNRKNRKK